MASQSDLSTGSKLVSPEWLLLNGNSGKVRIFEIAGLGNEDRSEYVRGHIPGAVCWSWKEMLWDDRRRDFPDPEEFARRMGSQDVANDTTVVVYGEDVMFGSYAWWVLTYCGHADVRLLDGGRYGWIAAGQPLEAGELRPAESRSYRPVARSLDMRIGREDVLALLGTGRPILDARSAEEYSGKRLAPPGFPDNGAVRHGRIPGAVNLHYRDILDEHRRFRKPEDIASIVAGLTNSTGDGSVAYCRLSHRATMLYFALTQLLGRKDVRVYDGSWTEWGNLVDYPVEL